MNEIQKLSNAQLREAISEYGDSPGPITCLLFIICLLLFKICVKTLLN